MKTQTPRLRKTQNTYRIPPDFGAALQNALSTFETDAMYYFDSRAFGVPVRKRLVKLMRNVAKLQKKTTDTNYIRVFKRNTEVQESRENKYRPTKPAGDETQTALLLRQSLGNAYDFLARLLDPVVPFTRDHETILAAGASPALSSKRTKSSASPSPDSRRTSARP